MLVKAVLVCLLVTVAYSAPQSSDDDDDIPVYTEKVVPSKPTPAPSKPSSGISRFQSKKLKPKVALVKPVYDAEPDYEPKEQYKPVKSSHKPILRKALRRTRAHPHVVRGPLRGEHAAPQPTYASVPQDLPRYEPHHDNYRSRGAAPALDYVKPPVQDYVPPPPYKDDLATGYEINAYDSNPQPYSFGYEIKDGYGSTQNRKEEDDGYGNKKGSYGYTDGYGIYRQVDYIADKNGFRATVKTNEPGTDNQNPADVHMLSEAIQYVDDRSHY